MISAKGLGTIISSGWGKPCSKTQVFVGVLQFTTSYLIIGWIMSILWGLLIVVASWKKDPNESNQPSNQERIEV